MRTCKPIWILLGILTLAAVACLSFNATVQKNTPTPEPPTPAQNPTKIPPTTIAPIPPLPSPTADAGRLQHIPAGLEVTLKKIKMVNETTGWGVAESRFDIHEHLLRTTDGGNTWQDVSPSMALVPPLDQKTSLTFFAMDEKYAWVISAFQSPAPGEGAPVVWFTRDGGESWEASSPLEVTSQREFFIPQTLYFAKIQNGWLMAHVGAGMSHDYVSILTTRDGGKTWTEIVNPMKDTLPMSCSKHGLSFMDERRGWVGGDCNGVVQTLFFYLSEDGGATWNEANVPTPAGDPNAFSRDDQSCGAYPPVLLTSRSGYLQVVCNEYMTKHLKKVLYWTDDGGATWKQHRLPAVNGALQFIDSNAGWFIGTQKVYATSDGGKTWKAISNVSWEGEPDFVNEKTGWVIARSGEATALVKSSDGGIYWSEIKPRIVP